MYAFPKLTGNDVSTHITIKIKSDNNWECSANKVCVDKNICSAMLCLSDELTDETILEFTRFWSRIGICSGINDFRNVIDSRIDIGDQFPDIEGNKMVHLENINMKRYEKDGFSVIRGVACEILTDDLL